jgi:hypothetical protein
VNKVNKIDHNAQTAVMLLAIFLCGGMMFVVPSITEKAMATNDNTIEARAEGQCGPTGDVKPCILTWGGQHMYHGYFQLSPSKGPTEVATWKSANNGRALDNEGYVYYEFGGNSAANRGIVQLDFYNPGNGANTCHVNVIKGGPGGASGRCTISSGNTALAVYTLSSRVHITGQ